MTTRWLGTGLALALAATTAQAQGHYEGDPEAGQTKAVTCVACHGQDGNSNGPEWPKLAGQHPKYLVRQLKLFKSGERANPIMMGMSAALSEQDMADIAAFYASQEAKPGVADESLVRQGQELYRAGHAEVGVPACMACHGASGLGNPGPAYPRLGGQHAQYVETTLKAFRDGAIWGRGERANIIMSQIAERLTDAEIRALASYIEGLH